MSRVYFHSPSGTAVLRGSERVWCDSVVRNMGMGVLGEYSPLGDQVSKIKQLIDKDHWLAKETGRGEPRFWEHFKLALHGYSGDVLSWKGTPLSSFSFALNTGLLLGNDTVKLMAYLHGQCEIHGWIAGEDRYWYSDLIADGRASGLLRADARWEDVSKLLLQTRDEPVVTSYSVTDSFPNLDIAGMTWSSDEEYESLEKWWSEESDEYRWARGMQGILAREQPGSSYRWSPEVFATQKFGHELSFFDLLADDVLERVERAMTRE